MEPYTKIMVRDLRVEMCIGIRDYEYEKSQPVLVNLEALIEAPQSWETASYQDTVCYSDLVAKIKKMAAEGHTELVETFAERIAALCLEKRQVKSVKVRVEKTEAVPDTEGVGVAIQRSNA